VITNLKQLIIGMILLYVSSIFVDNITIYNLTPNILLPWVIYISTRLNYKWALSFTFLISLGYDILNPQLLGFTTIIFLTFAHFVCQYNANFNKRLSSVLFSLFVANVIFYMAQWLYFLITIPEPLFLLGKAGLTIVYNTIISCVLIYIIYFFDRLRFNLK